MSVHKVTLTTALALALGAPAMAASEAGWICKQDSSRYGSLTCYVTPHNFRMDAMDLRLYVKAPFTDVTMYNVDGKLRYQVSVANLGSRVSIRSLDARDKKAGTKEVIVKQGKRTISGFNCQEYMSVHIKKNGNKRPRVLIYATKDLDLPQSMEIACARLTDCPVGLGFPVRLQIFDEVEDKTSKAPAYKLQQMLNTIKADKAQIDDKIFVEPKGFKTARDEMEIMIGAPP